MSIPRPFKNALEQLPIPVRQDCINEADWRWKVAVAEAFNKAMRNVSITLDQSTDTETFGLGVELREAQPGGQRDMCARTLAAAWASIAPPGDRTAILWANPIECSYGIVPVGGEIGAVACNPAFYPPGAVNIRNHCAVRPGTLLSASAVVDHTWYVTDAGTQDDAPLTALGLGTKYDSYAALALALGTLPPYDVINTATGLNQFFYHVVEAA